VLRASSSARRGGFALADFVAGSLVLSATLTAFVALTNSKFQVLRAAELRSRAQVALEQEVDRVRLEGLAGLPAGQADLQGYRLVSEFEPGGALPAGEGRVEARALRIDGGVGRRLYEARVSVGWLDRPGDPGSRVVLRASTIVPYPGEGGQ